MAQSSTPIGLDAEELAHLAMNLAAQGRHEEAILYLKSAISQEPDNAHANYFLGAEYAQIGMYDRAVERMQRAAVADPELIMAPFQAGMLLMTLGRGDEAISSWRKLDGLDSEHPLRLMVVGLEALLRDDFARCTQYLTCGIDQNKTNDALNNDMRKILTEIERRGLLNQTVAAAVTSEAAAAAGKEHNRLAAYRKDRPSDKH